MRLCGRVVYRVRLRPASKHVPDTQCAQGQNGASNAPRPRRVLGPNQQRGGDNAEAHHCDRYFFGPARHPTILIPVAQRGPHPRMIQQPALEPDRTAFEAPESQNAEDRRGPSGDRDADGAHRAAGNTEPGVHRARESGTGGCRKFGHDGSIVNDSQASQSGSRRFFEAELENFQG